MENYIIENKNYSTLNFLSLGHEACKPSHTFSYAYTDFYLVHYIVRGCGCLYKNGVPRKVNAGEMFIIKPDNSYTYVADKEDPWEYIWFSFDGILASIFDKLDDCVKYSGGIVTEMLDAKDLENTRTEFLLGKLYELISELFENSKAENNYVKKAADYIKANYMHRMYVCDIAQSLHINSRYLSRIFKEVKGISIQEYMINYKIGKAKTLLKRGLNVTESAKLVGYDDTFTFSKIFKKHTGCSPSEYAMNYTYK